MIERLFVLLIRAYRAVLSPLVGDQCRFHPTCSAYAEEAIKRHGALKGGLLAALRLLNCQPWSSRRPIDPVPERFAWRDFIRYKGEASRSANKDKPAR